jgi:AcrR family transcriptional regulator
VLRAAIVLADRGGIEALSMRKLAQKLGVEAMSLYNHVANKDDLLDGILESVASEIDLAPDAADWKAAMRRRAISAHEVLSDHPWACSLWMSGTSSGRARLRFADAVLRGLREAGFSPDLTYHGFHVIQSYILGFTLQEQAADFDVKDLETLAARFLRDFPADDYPDLAEHIRQHIEPDDDHEGAFAFGLDLILDGLERRATFRGCARPESAEARRSGARPRAEPRP